MYFSVYVLGHVSRFEKKLEKQIRTREREIERMCGFHYTNFVEAINELSGIEGDATKLVRKVASTNHDLQELGGKILGMSPSLRDSKVHVFSQEKPSSIGGLHIRLEHFWKFLPATKFKTTSLKWDSRYGNHVHFLAEHCS